MFNKQDIWGMIKFKVILFLLASTALFYSCKTNPPSSPDIEPTGNVVLSINLNTTQNFNAAGKVVLIEDFANVSCDPCVKSNKIIESLTNYTYGRDKLVAVKFPTNFPSSNDPFYLANSEDCDARMSYYNIFFAPTTIIDGIERPLSTDSSEVKAAIDNRLALNPQFNISVTKNLEGDFFINVTISGIDTSGVNVDDLVIHTVLTETDIEFENPPGSNGETKFYDVLRLMLPNNQGESFRRLINEGEINLQFTDALLSSWVLEHLNAVVYIQDQVTKEVYQAGSTF